MASDTESPFPPLLRTVTTSTDMSLPLATPSASLILVLPDLSSRGLSSTLATARGPLMLLMDTELDTESPSPPPLRTATTFTDTSWPLATPSASLILVPLALSSRGLSSTLATARGPLSLSTEEWLSTLDTPCLPLTGLLRVSASATAMGSTGTARGPLMPTTELLPLPTLSARPTLATLDLTSRCLAFTPGSATATEATFTKRLRLSQVVSAFLFLDT